jgi:hypothetical protein
MVVDLVLVALLLVAIFVSALWLTNYIVRSLSVPDGTPMDKFLGWFAWYRSRTDTAYWYRILATPESYCDGTQRSDYWTRRAPGIWQPAVVEYYVHGRLVQRWVR